MKHLYPALLFFALIPAFVSAGITQSRTKLDNYFIENLGQVKTEKGNAANNVLFYKTGALQVYVTNTGFSVLVKQPGKKSTTYNKIDYKLQNASIRKNQVVFVKSKTPIINIYGHSTTPLTDAKSGQTVLIKNIYPGIDWLWTIDSMGRANHEFMVNYGADASIIHYSVSGGKAEKMADNMVKYSTNNFSVKEGPVTYATNKATLPGKVKVSGSDVSFEISNELKQGGFTIDPPLELDWSYGGDTSTYTGFRSIVHDDSLNTYTAGYSNDFTLPVFPQVTGSYTTENPESTDAVIMKTDYNQNLLWATYFGGSHNDEANAIVATPTGIYVTGYSESWDFPVEPAINGNYDSLVALNGRDAFITKFNSVGKLSWSTGYGGSGTDEATDIKYYNGHIYIVGYTTSTNFPVLSLAGAYNLSSDSVKKADAFLLEFDTLGNRVWATCFGGNSYTYMSSVYVDPTGIYTTGYCDSIGIDSNAQIPLQAYNGAYYQTTFHNIESFVTQFTNAGALQWSTYFGGNGDDVASCILRNNCGLYICGKTTGSGLPILNAGGGSYYQPTYGGGSSDGFIAQFDPNNYNLTLGTYFGNAGTEVLTRMASDQNCNTVYAGFSNNSLPVNGSEPYFFDDITHTGGFDGLMLGLNANMRVYWATLFGTRGNDYAYGLQFTSPYVVDMVGEGFFNFGNDTIGGTYLSQNTSCAFVTCNGESNRFFNCGYFDGQVVDSGLLIIVQEGGGGGCNGLPVQFPALIPLRTACPDECNGWAELDTSNIFGCPPYQYLWSSGGQSNVDTSLCVNYWGRVIDQGYGSRTMYSKFDVLRVPAVGIVNTNCLNIPNWDSIIQPAGGTPPYTISFRGTSTAVCPTTAYFGVVDSVGCVVSFSTPWYQNNVNLTPLLAINGKCELLANFNSNNSNCVNTNYSQGWNYAVFSGNDTVVSAFQADSSIQSVTSPTSSGYYSGILNLGDCIVPVAGIFFYQKPDFEVLGTPDCANNNGVIKVIIQPDLAALHYYGIDTVFLAVSDSTTGSSVINPLLVQIHSNSPDTVSFPGLAGDVYHVACFNNSCDSTIKRINLATVQFAFNNPYVNCGDTIPLIANVTNGLSPYTYSWSTGSTNNGFINIDSPAIYTLTVTDAAHCSAMLADTVRGTVGLHIDSIVALNTECPYSDGNVTAATAYVYGGAMPYVYLWSTGETISTAKKIVPFSNNTLVVTDLNNCSASASYYDSIPPQLQAYDTSYMPVCYSADTGVMNLYITGGFPAPGAQPFNIVWQGNAGSYYSNVATLQDGIYEAEQALPPDYYTYTVTDYYGCSYTGYDSVKQPLMITYTLDTISCLCYGDYTGEAEIDNIQSTISYTIVWSDGTQGPEDYELSSGSYTASIIDSNNCVYTANFYISQPLPLNALIDSGLGITCNGGVDTIYITGTGGVSPYGGDTGVYLVPPGQYSYYITDSNNCYNGFQFSIANPPFFSDSIWATQPTCYNQYQAAVNVSVSGGVPPYFIYTPDSLYTSYFSNGYGQLTSVPWGTTTVTVTDSHGCLLTASVSIDSNEQAQGYVEVTNPLCTGNSNGSATIYLTGGEAPFTYNGNSFYGSYPVNSLIAGNYFFTVYDSLGCSVIFNATLTDPLPLSVSDTVSVPILCNGQQATVLVSASGGTPEYNGTGAQHYYAGNYIVTITDANGCQAATGLNITQPDAIVNQVNAVQPSCNSSAGTIQLTTTGGTPNYVASVNGVQYSYTGAVNITPLQPNNYSLLISDSNGCNTSQQVTINNYVAIQGSITTTNPGCAQTGTGSVEIDITQGESPFTGPNGTFISSTIIGNLYAGSYTYTISDASGCQINFEAQLTDPAALSAGYNMVAPIQCYGSQATVDISATGGTPPVTGTGLLQFSAGQQQVTVQDANGCNTQITFDVQGPEEALVVSANVTQQPTCGQDSGDVTISASGGQGPYTIIDGNIFANNISLRLAAGSYTYMVQDALGCQQQILLSITRALVTLNVTSTQTDTPACYQLNGATLISATGGVEPYQLISQANSIYFSDTVTQYLHPGLYGFTVIDSIGCTDSITVNVVSNYAYNVEDTIIEPLCFGDSSGAIHLAIYGGVSPYTVLLTSGPASINIQSPYTDSLITFTGLIAGSYQFQITDSVGCQQDVYPLLAYPNQLFVDSNMLQSGILCTGASNAVINISASGGSPGYVYTVTENGSILASQPNNIVTGLSQGLYTVIVTDSNQCADTLALTVPPFVRSTDSVVVDNATCYSTPTGAIKIYSLPAYRNPYTYSLDGAPAQVYNVFYNLNAGNYQVVVTDTNNCPDTLNITITQPDSIDGRVWLNGLLLPVDTLVLTDQGFANFTKLNTNPWTVSFSPNLTDSVFTDTSVLAQTTQTVSYTVRVYMDTSDKACFIEYNGVITVLEIADLPNTITPNGDGFNDVWKIDLLKYPGAYITIFDRWGEVVYTSTDYVNDWGGTDQRNGKPLPDGTYFYILKVPLQNNAIYKGDINIVDSKH